MTTMEKVYQDGQNACGLKYGDYVKLICKANDFECGWKGKWESSHMDKFIGEVGLVIGKPQDEGVPVRFTGQISEFFYLPYFILEKTTNPVHKFLPFDKVLIRVSTDKWMPVLYQCQVDTGKEKFPIRHSVIGFGQFVTDEKILPYEGNESLVKTMERDD